MTLRLTLFSQEVEDFVVEIKIDAEATFADLHRLILADCGYQEIDGQKFLLCDEDWRVEKQVCMRGGCLSDGAYCHRRVDGR